METLAETLTSDTLASESSDTSGVHVINHQSDVRPEGAQEHEGTETVVTVDIEIHVGDMAEGDVLEAALFEEAMGAAQEVGVAQHLGVAVTTHVGYTRTRTCTHPHEHTRTHAHKYAHAHIHA
jgi:hypothetical protein